MESPGLKLIDPRGTVAGGTRRAGPGFVIAAIIVVTALLATWFGADDARRIVDTRKAAETTLQLALERGREDTEVRRAIVDLRRTFGRRPLDARTRIVYASLLLGLSSTVEETRLAAFHAARAAQLAPVTVPVVSGAALILAHTGDDSQSASLIRAMFGYDPETASRVLAQVELLLTDEQVDSAIPEAPEAWMTWASRFRQDGRTDEARERERLTVERWPDHLPALERVAARALLTADLALLAELFPPDRDLPQEEDAAMAFLARARLRVDRGDRAGARADIENAIRLKGDSAWIRVSAGEVYQVLEDVGAARSEWNRGLHLIRTGNDDVRHYLVVRLARLEDRHGRPSAALRLWESLLELEPDHAEARRRVEALRGFQR